MNLFRKLQILRVWKSFHKKSKLLLNESDITESFTIGSGRGGSQKDSQKNCVVLQHKPTKITVHVRHFFMIV